MISFGSVCSGIEAASVAWGPLGWRAAWLAEIEAFPAAVLAHHYPEVPNLGDMTQIAAMVRAGLVEAPDVLCGGTPCQAFSVAGLRRSLDDARGNLSLTFCELANDIDTRRKALGKPPAVVFWENVPGVLTTRDNAFGCFLAGLAGESDPLQPPGGKWAHAGVVLGPQRTVAWRILDAQYFGVAQRRRRVFVVASARTGFDPAKVLFEFDGLRRDTAPRREAGQNLAGCLAARTDGGGFPGTDEALGGYVQPAVVGPLTAACGPNGHGGSGLATDKGAEAGHILAFGGNRTSGAIDVSPALLAQPGSGWKGDFESETFLVAHTLRGEGFDASEDGTGRGTPLVPVCHVEFMPTMTAGGPTDTSHNQISGQMREQYLVPMAYGGHNEPEVLQVRRLTPVECERLQGFPDGYTAIPWRGRPASQCPDGPRYKALGNSWAVPVVAWLGERIYCEILTAMIWENAA